MSNPTSNERLTLCLQAVMAELANLLESDQFNRIEAIVLRAGVPYPPLGTDPRTQLPPETNGERMGEFVEFVENWAKAYPLDVFPQPDMYKVNDALRAAGLSLDQVSASNMRHVITSVRDQLRRALKSEGEPK